MQLFSVGLKMLNNNGTIQVNDDGSKPLPYTNEDIAEVNKSFACWLASSRLFIIVAYIFLTTSIHTFLIFHKKKYAKVYLGFWQQNLRGNVDGNRNHVDPLLIRALFKDHLPKVS